MKRYLIVNADDFGYYKAADEGIVQAVQNGIVKSATVVVNMPNAEHAAQTKKSTPELSTMSCGLHFNLTHGKALSPEANSLTDKNGDFFHTPDALADKGTPDDIAKELHEQLKRFHELFNKMPSHIDSHKHIHRKNNVLSVLIEAAQAYKLPVRANSPYVHEQLKRAGIAATDYFIGDVSVGPFWTKEKLITTLRGLPEGVTELMCHPGYTDKNGEYIGFYNAQREGELYSLCDEEVKKAIYGENISLISFHHLSKD